jgi:hypothetical protein
MINNFKEYRESSPVTVRKMTDEEREKYGPPAPVDRQEKPKIVKPKDAPEKQDDQQEQPSQVSMSGWQLNEIHRLADLLRKDISRWNFKKLTFETAYIAIQKMTDEWSEAERLRNQWTESQVRARLKKYNEDDSFYDAKIARPSQMNVSFTSSGDAMLRAMFKILKRVDLERAIRGALLPARGFRAKSKKELQEIKKKDRLYRVIRLIYVLEQGVTGTAILLDMPHGNVSRDEKEAVSLITGYLNAQGKKDDGSKPFKDIAQP